MLRTRQAAVWPALFVASFAVLSGRLPVAGLAAGRALAQSNATTALKDALLFHAGFDNGTDASFGRGDRRLYTAASFREQQNATPGLNSPDAEITRGGGRFGSALKFTKQNMLAIFYNAENNIAFSKSNWSGTVSFWLSVDMVADLPPRFCDPIQITDSSASDGAVWVDFTNPNPRSFRLGVFGDQAVWNPENVPLSQYPPAFNRRIVVVQSPPFAGGKWTHIAITHDALGGGQGTAKLYLDGKLRGTTEKVAEPFTLDASKTSIRLGVNYVGLFDELAIFNRALTDSEVRVLYELATGVSGLHS